MDTENTTVISRLAGLRETIVTPRTVIEALRPEDAEEYVLALHESWAEMNRWVTWAKNPIEATVEEQIPQVKKRLAEFSLRQSFFMVARDPDTREIMSFVTLYGVQDDARSMEAGYWTRKKYMGQGITTEAMTGLVKWGFEEVGARRMVAHHPERHEASARTLQKIGFVFGGVADKTMRMDDGREVRSICYKLDAVGRIPALDVVYR